MSTTYPLEIILTPNKTALSETGTQPLQVLVRLRPQQDPVKSVRQSLWQL